MVERQRPSLSVARQCRALGISRSSLYYQPVGVSQEVLELMKLLDKQYLERPFFGSPADGYMAAWAGLPHQSEASGPSHGSDGAKSHLSEA